MNESAGLIPNPKKSLIFKPESILERIRPDLLFPNIQPLEVELGSGDGSFLAKYAQLHPEKNFIGLERLLGRLRKIDKKGLRANLDNLKLIRLEASYFLEFLIPPKSVSALHIYFPDPWPKRKHRKNRLVNVNFTKLAETILQPTGIVYLRTDDADYFSQMRSVFSGNPSFQRTETPEFLSGVVTDFERNFHLRGVPTLAAAYRLK